MKMKKRFMLTCGIIALATALHAQPEVCYKSGTALPGFYTRLGAPDTVTVAEMQAGFWKQEAERFWWNEPVAYNGIADRNGRCGLLFVRSPLEGCGLLKGCTLEARLQTAPADSSTGLRRQYVLTGLWDRSTGSGHAAQLAKVARHYGTAGTDGGTRMPWMEGTYVCLQQPLRYFGFTVSGVRRVMLIRRGCISDWGVTQTCRSLYERYAFESAGLVRADGHWAQDVTGAMRLLSFESRRWTSTDTAMQARRPFTLLFIIDARGRLDVEVLKPRTPSAQDLRYVDELRKAVRQLPPWSLGMLYTSDGRVFPGRYIEAYRHNNRWTFHDYLQYGYSFTY